MAFRLTDSQAQLIDLVERALRQPPTLQLRFFWRKLRQAALPEIPKEKRGQDPEEYALTQVRWQRLAALSAESHVAAAGLLKDELAIARGIEERKRAVAAELTSDDAIKQIAEVLSRLPDSLYYSIVDAENKRRRP